MGLALRKTAIKNERTYTATEYLALKREADKRHEYLDGVIYAMTSESHKHGDISVNLVAEIARHLKSKICHTYTKDSKIRSGPLPKWRSSTKGLFS